MTRPGESVEGITVPRGDPAALERAAGQLSGVAAQLDDSAGRLAGLPSLMDSWAGPASSAFALHTGREATSVRSSAASVTAAAFGVSAAAEALAGAQRRARRAIVRAEHAREEIERAREAIREARAAQDAARGRMAAAAAAREAAELRAAGSLVDARAVVDAAAAEAEFRDAERDLLEAEREERRARHRLDAAEDDLRAARRDGRAAADDAEAATTGLRVTLGALPPAALALPGAPAGAHIAATGLSGARIARAQIAAGGPPREAERPIDEREPPAHWPGWAQSWFKIGRGAATAIDGALRLGRAAVEHPERIPGAALDAGERAVEDPLGTAKELVGYDELASGRYEDWLGQIGVGAFAAGAGTLPARASQLRRVVGPPKPHPVGRRGPINSRRFAGRRLDFTRPDCGVRDGCAPPKIRGREELAAKYPNGVRFTRAGYPVLTPYAIERVQVEGLTGSRRHDSALANEAVGRAATPDHYTWHHVEDGHTMELVPRDLHHAVRHTGGGAAIENLRVGDVAPGGVLTQGERASAGAGAAGGATVAGPASAERPP